MLNCFKTLYWRVATDLGVTQTIQSMECMCGTATHMEHVDVIVHAWITDSIYVLALTHAQYIHQFKDLLHPSTC